MKITYPSEHKWIEPVTEVPDSALGKNNRARLRATVKKLPDSTVSHRIEPLTEATLEWFTPLYNETIAGKNNPKLFDIHASTLGKNSEYTYYSLTLFENNKPIGAVLFSERKAILSIAYRIFPNSWSENDLQANPSLYAEYLLNEYAWQRGYKKISHGKDRNPYGLNSYIGLGMFKLSVGCKAYLPTTDYEVKTLDLAEVDTDILVLLQPTEGKQITHAILYASEEAQDKYSQLQKYSDRLQIEVITRPLQE